MFQHILDSLWLNSFQLKCLITKLLQVLNNAESKTHENYET